MPKRILFVCTGNSCRSPMAQGLFKKMLQEKGISEIEVLSAGTSAVADFPAALNAQIVMAEEGVDLSLHRAVQIIPEMIEEADLILTMGQSHKEVILNMRPSAAGKVYTLKEYSLGEKDLDIGDPMGRPIEEYRICAAEIKNCLHRLLEKIFVQVEKRGGSS